MTLDSVINNMTGLLPLEQSGYSGVQKFLNPIGSERQPKQIHFQLDFSLK